MNRTRLTMLPSQRYDNPSEMPVMERDGFVDDAVVLALLAGPIQTRQLADSGDLVLSADDMDFAGWELSRSLPRHATEAVYRPKENAIRRAAPPELEEPGLGEPHRGNHRWWLAGLAGALSTMLFSVLLLSLSSRDAADSEDFSVIRLPAKSQADPNRKSVPSSTAQELTDVSPLK